jgi:hypothetical protein
MCCLLCKLDILQFLCDFLKFLYADAWIGSVEYVETSIYTYLFKGIIFSSFHALKSFFFHFTLPLVCVCVCVCLYIYIYTQLKFCK